MKNLLKLRYWILIGFVGFNLLQNSIYSHDNTIIHPYLLSSKAQKLLLDNYPGNEYKEVGNNFNLTPTSFDQLPAYNEIKKGTLGTIEEDNGIRPRNHFYNPHTGYGILAYKNAYEYGPILWNDAIKKYTAGDKEGGYYEFGRALHVMQDMTSPGHVHTDMHFSITWFEDYWNQSETFEPWEKNMANALSVWEGTIVPTFSNYQDAIHQIAMETNEDVRIRGTLFRDEEQPCGDDLAVLFPAISYLNYIPTYEYNPLTDDYILVDEHWSIAGVGNCYSGPDGFSTFTDDWWRCSPRSATESYYYIENVALAIPRNYWSKSQDKYVDNENNYSLPLLWAGNPFDHDAFATRHQNKFIIPKTIEYTAGLMKLFYDTANVIPRITEVELRQSDGIKYWAKIKYDSVTNKPKKLVYVDYELAPGSACVYITFDTEMDTAEGRTDVRFGNNEPYYDTYGVTYELWSSTLEDFKKKNQWIGTFEVPKTGKNRLNIQAYGKNGRQIDKDGDLSEYNPGPDTEHEFGVDETLANVGGFGGIHGTVTFEHYTIQSDTTTIVIRDMDDDNPVAIIEEGPKPEGYNIFSWNGCYGDNEIRWTSDHTLIAEIHLDGAYLYAVEIKPDQENPTIYDVTTSNDNVSFKLSETCMETIIKPYDWQSKPKEIIHKENEFRWGELLAYGPTHKIWYVNRHNLNWTDEAQKWPTGNYNFVLYAIDGLDNQSGPAEWSGDVVHKQDFITKWLISDFYQYGDFNLDLLVNRGGESGITPFNGLTMLYQKYGETKGWSEEKEQSDYFLDLTSIYGGTPSEDGIRYACSYVESDSEQDVHLRIGSEQGFKVYVNGEFKLSREEESTFSYNQHIVPITLNEGWNKIFVKLKNVPDKDSKFCARLTDTDGYTLDYSTHYPAGHIEAYEGQGEAPVVSHITAPLSGFLVIDNTPLQIKGYASGTDFQGYYKVEYTQGIHRDITDSSIVWTTLKEETASSKVDNGLLDTWDTTGLADGIYTIRLTVKDSFGNEHYTTTSINIDRTTIDITVSDTNTNTITYTLSRVTNVTVKIYNSDKTQLLETLVDNEERYDGENKEVWLNATNGTYKFEVIAYDETSGQNVTEEGAMTLTDMPVLSNVSVSRPTFYPRGGGKKDIIQFVKSNYEYDNQGNLKPNLKMVTFLNKGNGSFEISSTNDTLLSGDYDTEVCYCTGDFNDDGNIDFVIVTSCYHQSFKDSLFKVIFGNGNGTFSTPVEYNIGNGIRNISVFSGDFDKDNDVDLVFTLEFVSGVSANNVVIYKNDGIGGFTKDVVCSIDGVTLGITGGDIDKDGDIDLITTNLNRTISILKNSGDGTFIIPGISETYNLSKVPHTAKITDFNADGNLDILTVNRSENWMWNTSIPTWVDYRFDSTSRFLNNGDGTFTYYYEIGILPSGNFNDLIATDFNGNGYSDVIVASHENVVVNYDGFVQTQVTQMPGTNDYDSVFIVDIDGDGAKDVIAGALPAADVFLNNRNKTFTKVGSYSTGLLALAHPIVVISEDIDAKSKDYTTTISYNTSKDSYVTISILDSDGEVIKTLKLEQFKKQGTNYQVDWDGTNKHGKVVKQGIYKYKIEMKDVDGNVCLKEGTITAVPSNITTGLLFPVPTTDPPITPPDPSDSPKMICEIPGGEGADRKEYWSYFSLTLPPAPACEHMYGWFWVPDGFGSYNFIKRHFLFSPVSNEYDRTEFGFWEIGIVTPPVPPVSAEDKSSWMSAAMRTIIPMEPYNLTWSGQKISLKEQYKQHMFIEDDAIPQQTVIDWHYNHCFIDDGKIIWDGRIGPNQWVDLNTNTTYGPVVSYDTSADPGCGVAEYQLQIDETAPVISSVTITTSVFSPVITSTAGTTISYTTSETHETIICKIYNGDSNIVKQYMVFRAGEMPIFWNGTNTKGEMVSDGLYTFTLEAIDMAGNEAIPVTGPTIKVYGRPISAKDGGVTRSEDDNVELHIPPGAITEDIKFDIKQTAKPSVDYNFIAFSNYYDISPDGTDFSKPVTLVMYYNPSGLDEADQERLGIFFFDTDTLQWEYIGGIVDLVNHSVTVQINHLSTYVVGLWNDTPSAPVIDAFSSLIQQSTITVTGQSEPGTTVNIYVNGNLAGNAYAVKPNNFTVSDIYLNEGENEIKAVTVNSLGNPSADSNIITVNLDTTGPNTAHTIEGPYIAKGGDIYVNQNTYINLIATDSISGVNKTYYRIDGGDWIEYVSSFTITGPDGVKNIEYWSSDTLGNQESSHSLKIVLNTVLPESPVLLSPENDGTVEDPYPVFDWTDVASEIWGIQNYEIQVDNNSDFSSPEYSGTVSTSQVKSSVAIVTGNEYFWRVRAKDNSDNYSNWSTAWKLTKVNAVPSTPQLISPKNRYINTSTITFRLFASDLDNDSLKYKICLSNDDFATIIKTFDQTATEENWTVEGGFAEYAMKAEDALSDGIYQWYAYAYDEQIWSNISNTAVFSVDTTAPEIVISSPVSGEQFLPTDIINIGFTVTDLSPVTTTGYLTLVSDPSKQIIVKDGDIIDPLSIDDGFWTLTVEAEDKLGHMNSITTGQFEVVNMPYKPVVFGIQGEKYISYIDPDGTPGIGDDEGCSGKKY
ncbi:MAG: VCBS repeat-containing protein, partial [Elusimicrobia bacterium]|nr:VCBS repeat-containing protein [Elusimicrobiota bacterium]